MDLSVTIRIQGQCVLGRPQSCHSVLWWTAGKLRQLTTTLHSAITNMSRHTHAYTHQDGNLRLTHGTAAAAAAVVTPQGTAQKQRHRRRQQQHSIASSSSAPPSQIQQQHRTSSGMVAPYRLSSSRHRRTPPHRSRKWPVQPAPNFEGVPCTHMHPRPQSMGGNYWDRF